MRIQKIAYGLDINGLYLMVSLHQAFLCFPGLPWDIENEDHMRRYGRPVNIKSLNAAVKATFYYHYGAEGGRLYYLTRYNTLQTHDVWATSVLQAAEGLVLVKVAQLPADYPKSFHEFIFSKEVGAWLAGLSTQGDRQWFVLDVLRQLDHELTWMGFQAPSHRLWDPLAVQTTVLAFAFSHMDNAFVFDRTVPVGELIDDDASSAGAPLPTTSLGSQACQPQPPPPLPHAG